MFCSSGMYSTWLSSPILFFWFMCLYAINHPSSFFPSKKLIIEQLFEPVLVNWSNVCYFLLEYRSFSLNMILSSPMSQCAFTVSAIDYHYVCSITGPFHRNMKFCLPVVEFFDMFIWSLLACSPCPYCFGIILSYVCASAGVLSRCRQPNASGYQSVASWAWDANRHKLLGKFDLVCIPPALRGSPQIEVTLDVGAKKIQVGNNVVTPPKLV